MSGWGPERGWGYAYTTTPLRGPDPLPRASIIVGDHGDMTWLGGGGH